MATQLFVNGIELDITSSDRLPLSVSRKVDEIEDLTKRAGDRTATFGLPYSPNNVRFFGDLAAPSGTRKFNRAIAYVCDIVVDGVMIFRSASLKLTEVSRDEGFKCYIVAANVNFATAFKERRLRDTPLRAIPFSGGLDVVAINAAVDTTNPAQYVHPELFDCVFPLTAYNRFFIPNKWTRGNSISQKLYSAGSGGFNGNGTIALPAGKEILDNETWSLGRNNLDGNANLDFASYPPAVYIARIIKAMFGSLGFVATGKWLEDVEVRKMISLFTATSGQLPAWNWGTLGTLEVTSDGSVNGTFDDLTYYETQTLISTTLAGVFFHLLDNVPIRPQVIVNQRSQFTYNLPAYVVPFDGQYRVTVTLNGTFVTDNSPTPYKRYIVIVKQPVGADENYLQNLILNGGLITDFSSPPDLIFDPEKVTVLGELPTGLGAFAFSANSVVSAIKDESLHAMFVLTAAPGIATYANSLTNLSVTFENITADVDLQPARFLPDVDQITFWKAIVSMFNLYVLVNPINNTVLVENYPNFYEPNDKALELECDPNSFTISPIECAKEYVFNYENDENDYPLKSSGGALQFQEIGTVNTIYAKGSQPVTAAPFAPTKFETYTIVQDTANNFLTPTFTPTAEISLPSLVTNEADLRPQNDWENFTPPTGFKPRIVKVKELVTLPSGAWLNLRVWDGSLAPNLRDKFIQQNQYVRCVFDDTDTPAVPTVAWSLNWKGERGLFRLNYESQLYLYQYSHVAVCQVRLTAPQFWQLTLQKKVRINGDVYYLQELKDYNPTKNNLVTLTLIKVL